MTENFDLEQSIIKAAQKIDHVDYAVNEINTAASPVLFFYFGDAINENIRIIYDLINTNWARSGRYIKHVGVNMQDGKYIVTDYVEDFTYDSDMSIEHIMNNLVRKVLEAPVGVFPDNRVVRAKFIMLSSDKDCEKYLQFSSQITTEFTSAVFKDVYLLQHEGGNQEETERTKKTIQYLYQLEQKKELEEFNNIFVLGDRLRNGLFVQKHEKKLNYRIIANAVLIMDSNDEDGKKHKREKFYGNPEGRCKTISHRLVGKPSFEIVCVIFKTILQIILEKQAKDRETINTSFEKEDFEEKYFKQMFAEYCPKDTDFRYLPYNRAEIEAIEKDYKLDRNNGNAYVHINEEKLDKSANGCLHLFYEENYIKQINALFQQDDFIKKLREYYIKKYSYKDIKEYFRYEDIVDLACQEKDVRVKKDDVKDIYSALAKYYYLKSQNEYFGIIRKPYLQTMKTLYDLAERYENQMIAVLNQIRGMYHINEKGINQSIESFYSEYTRTVYDTDEKNKEKNKEYKGLFDEILAIDMQDEEKVAAALDKILGKMILRDTKRELTCGFREELENRLGNARRLEERDNLIREEIQPNIDDYVRVHTKYDEVRDFYDVYLCGTKDSVVNDVKCNEIYKTNDENVVEHIKFYTFGSMGHIG